MALMGLFRKKRLPENSVDRIVVYKSRRVMHVFTAGRNVRTFRIALGRQPVGPKRQEGDFRTPEGLYHIEAKNSNSRFHKNLGISYPDATDRARAAALGLSPGGDIKIHGLRNGRGYRGRLHRLRDWTAGCIAVTNAEMDELYDAVPIGIPIEIFP
jgi:murein L,D-transpeptidase YafK